MPIFSWSGANFSDGMEFGTIRTNINDAFNTIDANLDEIRGNEFVTTPRIASGAVDGSKIASGAVTPEKTNFTLSGNKVVNIPSGSNTAQIQALITAEPRNLNGNSLTFKFENSTEPYYLDALYFYGFFGGWLNIVGNQGQYPENVLPNATHSVRLHFNNNNNQHGLCFANCSCAVSIDSLEIVDLSQSPHSNAILFDGVMRAHVYQCSIGGSSAPTSTGDRYGINCHYTTLLVYHTFIGRFDVGVYALRGGMVSLANCSATSPHLSRFGVGSAYGGVLAQDLITTQSLVGEVNQFVEFEGGIVQFTRSTDGTFAANSDVYIPTQKATKTYVDNNIYSNSMRNAATLVHSGTITSIGTGTTISLASVGITFKAFVMLYVVSTSTIARGVMFRPTWTGIAYYSNTGNGSSGGVVSTQNGFFATLITDDTGNINALSSGGDATNVQVTLVAWAKCR